MKLKYLLLGFSFCMIVFLSCKDETIKLEPKDGVAPGPVTNVTWDSIPGGAVFRYVLPDDEDLLYVKAVFYRGDGVRCESSATIYSDSLKIEGFGDTKPKEVQLIAVDRSENGSEPVMQTITPGVPDIFYVGQSLDVRADFGGVHAFWENKTKQDISVVLLIKDNNDEFVPLDTYYSSLVNGDGLYIGMDTIPVDCAVFAQDRWGNTSETKYYPELTPLYETLFDRNLFSALHLASDGPDYPNGWRLEEAFNGVKANNSGYSSAGGTGKWPQWVTIDMGITAKISRLRLYQRMDGYTFSEGNLKIFEVYGYEDTGATPQDAWDNWKLLIKCESIKPSGLPIGQNTVEDEARARNGEDFYNSADNPAVRYIRIKVLRTWGSGDNFQINEIEIFGDNR